MASLTNFRHVAKLNESESDELLWNCNRKPTQWNSMPHHEFVRQNL